MPRFKLAIEYQGTRYGGWQIQKNARTVQGEILAAVGKASGENRIELYGAGRTDAGVHALRQVAHLDLKASPDPEFLRRKINDHLPSDIYLLSVERSHPRFHARHQAVARSYLYQISRRRTAFGKKLTWWVKDDLDLEKMRKAAALFVGMKDCQSFSADEPEEKSTLVLMERVQIGEAGDLILIRIEGSHFLWKMVRRIVGVIVEAGSGKISLAQVSGFLWTKSEEPAKLAAPASGLFLERVYYEGEPRLHHLEPVLNLPQSGLAGLRYEDAPNGSGKRA
ncbi:MAG: tRNA pseudouridine(38-40) synthase TruA [Acidobacteriota bacterium]|jgi:tRNA pseudouridine38-40 synthase